MSADLLPVHVNKRKEQHYMTFTLMSIHININLKETKTTKFQQHAIAATSWVLITCLKTTSLASTKQMY